MKKDQNSKGKSNGSKSNRNLGSNWITLNLPYLFFLIFLAMIYIANAHWTEKKVRRINQLNKEVRELNANYMSIKSDVIYHATYTKLKEQVADLKLSNDGDLPEKLNIEK